MMNNVVTQSSEKVRPTEEELEAHRTEIMQWRAEAIQHIKKSASELGQSEERTRDEIRSIERGEMDTRLIYSKLLCSQCGELAVKAYDDHLNHTITKCGNCGCSIDFRDNEYGFFHKGFVETTIRKHNIEEMDWGKIVQSELDSLYAMRATLNTQIIRLENLINGVVNNEK